MTIQELIQAIKDIDGIKKIQQELPAGTQEIGKVAIDDGKDAALGATTDAMAAAGAAGTVSAKLRRATQGLEDLKTRITPVEKASLHAQSITGGSYMLGSYLSPLTPPSIFRIMCAFNTSGVMTIYIKRNDIIRDFDLNEGNALKGGAVYTFDVILFSGDTFNLSYSNSTVARVVRILEIPLPT